jgi:hypothetical protein
MTREQAKKIFPDATDTQINDLLDIHSTDIGKAKTGLGALQAEIDRLKPIETEYEKLKGASMTEQEKLQKQLEAAELAEKSYKKMTNRLTAEKLFVGEGLKEADYSELLDNIVSDNSELTAKTAAGLVGLLKAQKAATEKAVKEELMRSNPRPPAGGGGNGAVDKKAFDAMSSAEQMKFIADNPGWKEIIMKKE